MACTSWLRIISKSLHFFIVWMITELLSIIVGWRLMRDWSTRRHGMPHATSCRHLVDDWRGSWICPNGKTHLCIPWPLCLFQVSANHIKSLQPINSGGGETEYQLTLAASLCSIFQTLFHHPLEQDRYSATLPILHRILIKSISLSHYLPYLKKELSFHHKVIPFIILPSCHSEMNPCGEYD